MDNYFQGVSLWSGSQWLGEVLKCLAEHLRKYNTLLQLFIWIVAKVTGDRLKSVIIEASTTENLTMQELTFTTTVDEYGKPDSYAVDGTVTLQGEAVNVGLYTTNFNKAFDELIYWLHTVESDSDNASVSVTFKTN